MDEIRKALGADQISYFGFSYGSVLGVWYATLFPESVRAMVVEGADNPVDPATTLQQRVDEATEEAAPVVDSLEQALMACADPLCPIYNDGDPVGYFKQAAAKLGLVNSAADDNPEAGFLGVISALYSEEDWPQLWQGLFELNENDDPSILLDFARINLSPEPAATSFADHVNCLDDWVLHPELDRTTLLEDYIIIEATFEEMFPLLASMDPLFLSPCPFYDQFAPGPLERPLDGGGVPILVIGNHSDPFTPFSESEESVTDTLSNGYLLETSHFEHTVYPDNNCVNGHVHGVLIDGVYPGERRLFCEQEASPPSPEQTVITTKTGPPPETEFASVSAGGFHTCGVKTDGSAACWGFDDSGQATPPAGEFVSVSAGGSHNCGVNTDGSVICWGDDTVGQATPPVGEFISVSAGGFHTCGVKTDGSVECWGNDQAGHSTPPEGEFASVSVGDFHTCGVKTDGSAACWGFDDSGQATPLAGEFGSVSAGGSHNCGVKMDGSVSCWGDDTHVGHHQTRIEPVVGNQAGTSIWRRASLIRLHPNRLPMST